MGDVIGNFDAVVSLDQVGGEIISLIGREWKRGNHPFSIGVLDFQVMPESEEIAVFCFFGMGGLGCNVGL